MICGYVPICEKCYKCCDYFSAYLAFLFEFVQLINFVFLIIYIILIQNFLGDGGKQSSGGILAIVAVVFNAIHNVITCLIAGFRGNMGADVLNLKALLCCYICCPNCGSCWDTIMGVFGCTCIVDCLGGCFYTPTALLVEVLLQIITGILTFAFEFSAANLIGDESGFSFAITAMSILFLVFVIFNAILNAVCAIHYLRTECDCSCCKKDPVYNNNNNNSEDENFVDNNNQNNDEQQALTNQNDNMQPTPPNQNDDMQQEAVALEKNDTNQNNLSDPENPNNLNQQDQPVNQNEKNQE